MCQEIEREGEFYLSHCKYFKTIDKMKARAFVKDPAQAKIKGLCYRINQSDLNRYTILIKAWEYNIYNEYYERPVLSFSLLFDHGVSENFKIISAKIMSCPVIIDLSSTSRFMDAASLIIRQVQSGVMVDVDNVLAIYRIKPSSVMYDSITVNALKQKKSALEETSNHAH